MDFEENDNNPQQQQQHHHHRENEEVEGEEPVDLELEELRRVRRALSKMNQGIENIQQQIKYFNSNVGQTTQLLDIWVRILSQTAHNQRFLANEEWQGGSMDSDKLNDLQRRDEERKEEERRQQREAEILKEKEQAAALERERKRAELQAQQQQALSQNKPASAGAARGRGRGGRGRARGIIRGRGRGGARGSGIRPPR